MFVVQFKIVVFLNLKKLKKYFVFDNFLKFNKFSYCQIKKYFV